MEQQEDQDSTTHPTGRRKDDALDENYTSLWDLECAEASADENAVKDEYDTGVQTKASVGSDPVCVCPSTDDDAESQRPLTKKEKWNLLLAFLAWACTICNVNLVVGSSTLVAMSIGASPDQSTFPLGTFEIGASSVSLLVTPWIFRRYGRKVGLLCGVALGLVGTVLSIVSLLESLPGLFLVAAYCYGCAMGIGFYVRFAALELVPSHWASFAVGLVVGGGTIAAIAAPESAFGTKNMFGDFQPNLAHMGVILMTGIFNILNAVFVTLIEFPETHIAPVASEDRLASSSTACPTKASNTEPPRKLWQVLWSRHFVIPMAVAALSWAIMVLPMCVVRLAMFQLGFSARLGVTVIEGHFLGMYVPGFFSGKLIRRFGAKTMARMSVLLFAVAIAVLQLVDGSSFAAWLVGMLLLGAAWNIGFTSATVWTSQTAYDAETQPHLKSPVQAANDAFMFLFVGVWVMSSTYIFESVGGALPGWRVLSGGVLLGLLLVMLLLLVVDAWLDRRQRRADCSVLPLHQPA